MLYNPFEKVTIDILKTLLSDGNRYFILQRLQWPGSNRNWFILSAYENKDLAIDHVSHLNLNEGKLLNAPNDIEKISNLLKSGSGYRLFFGRIKDSDWSKRTIRMYQDKIIAYLKTKTNFKRTDHIDILFTLEYGRPIAKISNGTINNIVPAIQLLN